MKDEKIIGTNIYTKEEQNHFILRMKRSKFSVKIPFKVSNDIAYLTGVIVGDGNITLIPRKISQYPRTKIRIFNNSRKFLFKINKLFKETFNIEGKLYKKKDKNCFYLTINNKLVYLYFVKIIGLKPKKKNELEIPKLIKNKKLLKYFIAGLFDTDGYFSKTFGIMMGGSNLRFLKDIKYLLNDFYEIESRKMYYGTINTPTGIKDRCQMQVKIGSKDRFINIIPLKHSKYGPVV